MKELIPQERIEHRIFVIRGQKVLLDRDLAGLYGVPKYFMFRLTKVEIE